METIHYGHLGHLGHLHVEGVTLVDQTDHQPVLFAQTGDLRQSSRVLLAVVAAAAPMESAQTMVLVLAMVLYLSTAPVAVALASRTPDPSHPVVALVVETSPRTVSGPVTQRPAGSGLEAQSANSGA